MTIEAWVTPTATDNGGHVCTTWRDSGVALTQFSRWEFGLGGNRSIAGQYASVFAHAIVEPERKYHLAGVFDGKQVALFVDGVKQSHREVGKDVPLASRSPLLIGGQAGVGTFVGRIHSVRISTIARYEKHFTPQERFEPDEHTLALYHCDEGQGDVLVDSSAGGQHGKIHGAKWVRAEK